MPKQNHIISRFQGIVLDIAKEDLPGEVCVNNTRNVFFDQSGNGIGFGNHLSLYSRTEVKRYLGKFQLDSAERVFIINAANQLRHYTQQGTDEKTLSTGTTLIEDQITHAQRLNHTFIGAGNTSANTPLWFGKHFHQQFDVDLSLNEAEILPSKLFSPTQLSSAVSWPTARGVVRSGSFNYLISSDSPYVFKYNNQNLVIKSDVAFNNPTAICAGAGGNIWIYDAGSVALYELNASLAIVSTIIISKMPTDQKVIKDIILHNGDIWLLRGSSTSEYDVMTNWLMRVPASSGNSRSDILDNSYQNLPSNINLTPALINEGESNQEYDEYYENFRFNNWHVKIEEKGFVIHGSDLFINCRFDCGLTADYTIDNINTGASKSDRVEIDSYKEFSFTTSGTFGNLFVIKILKSSTLGDFDRNNVRLITDDSGDVRMDWISKAASSTVYLWSHNVNGQVLITTYNITGAQSGNLAVTKTIQTAYDGLGIQPIVVTVDGTHYFFSKNSPPRAGIQTSASVISGTVESAAFLNATAIPGGFSEEGKTYYYAFSFIYDGYMESPLSDFVTNKSDNDELGFAIKLQIPVSNINRRVSGINIYRSVGNNFSREEFFRLVDYISFKGPNVPVTVSGESVRVFEYNDRKGEFLLGPAYTSNSGIPETMKETLPHYGLSADLDDMLFIANCYHPDIDEAKYMIFRSQPYSYSSFNIEVDVLRLPTIPLAICAFNGRIYAADTERFYVVNPTNLTLDRTIENIGVINSKSLIPTNFGLIIVGPDEVRLFDGQSAQVLSHRINLHFGAVRDAFAITPGIDSKNVLGDYKSFIATASNIHCINNEKQNRIEIYGTISGHTIGYIYHLISQSWSRLVKPDFAFKQSISLSTGETMAITPTGAVSLYGSYTQTSFLAFDMELTPFDGGDANIEKWFYEIRVDHPGSQGAIAVKVKVDAGNYSANLNAVGQHYEIPYAQRKGKKLYVHLSGSVKVKSMSLFFRPKQVRS